MTVYRDDMRKLAMPAILVTAIPSAATVAAIASRNILFLDYDHVLLGAIWTGVDVFFGLIFRYVYREISSDTRITVARRMLPATLFFLPAASILTPLAGYYLASFEGIWNVGNQIVDYVIILTSLAVLTGLLTVFLQSLMIILAREQKDKENILLRRFSLICNGALAQALLQIGLISLMAFWVVFR